MKTYSLCKNGSKACIKGKRKTATKAIGLVRKNDLHTPVEAWLLKHFSTKTYFSNRTALLYYAL